jgi:pyruvate-ferredoxin/flavodoxin oxidoreductase
MKQYPKEADELFNAAKENAQWRYKSYQRMLSTQW